jgi:tetratricopeptide (TPR) repeat protein
MRRTLLAALVALTSACASFPSYRDLDPGAPPVLASSPPAPEIDALAARAYGNDPADLSAEIGAALAKSPQNGTLAEIAGYHAMVHGDTRAAFGHFLTAAADTSALAPEITLWELRNLARTATERRRLAVLLRELAARHPRPFIRQLATYDLARELRHVGEREEAAALVKTLGFIEPWMVLGAFDNDQNKGYQTEYLPEQDADTSRTHNGVRLPIRYRKATISPLDGALPLGDLIAPSDSAVAYALTFVFADRARQVDLRLSTTNAVRVFHNGKLAASDDKIAHDELDNVIVRLSLSAGWNRVLVKSAHQTGPFRLAARLTEIDGNLASGLRYAAAADGPIGPPAKGGLVSPSGAIDKLADKNRKRFLEGRLWSREGHVHRAQWYLDPLLKDVPHNALAIAFGARALSDNGESGKALDLWNRGIQEHPGAIAMLLDRARFYAQRKLWDKAQKDVETALAKAPSSREARIELASLYGQRGWTIDRCAELDAIVTAAPDDVRAISDLGRCKLDMAFVDEGERALRRAHALAPGDTGVLYRLFDVAERRADLATADQWIKALREARPTALDLLMDEADLRRREGKSDEAARLLNEAVALSPDASEPYDRLAQLALLAKNKPEAERQWRLALERDSDNASLQQRLARMSPGAVPLGDRLAPTADDIERAVRAADKIKVHPGSHYVVLVDDEVTTVNADGSSKRIVTFVAQAATTEGRDALIQHKLPPGGRVNVIEAYALKKNGERQEASSIQGGVVRFRGFEVGSIAVLQYTHYAPAPRFLPNEYVEQWRFQSLNAQVEMSRWRLILPKDRALNVETRGPVQSETKEMEGQKIWTFSVKEAPPLVPEPQMTPAVDSLWMAAVSTLASWDGYAKWEKALLADAFPPSPELDALAKKIVGGAQTPREKIDKLWAHVAQEIRYQQEYEETIAGVRPHAAGMVVERGYGDCKDKAVLMIRLAKAVGVDMRFALLRTTPAGKVLKQIPNQQFNHAIVYVPKQAGIDEGFFIDTTTNGLDIGNMRLDDEGALSLVIEPDSGRYEFIPIPYQPVDNEFTKHDIKADLRDLTKPVAHDHFTARGSTAMAARIVLRGGESGKKFYQNLSEQMFSGTTLIAGKSEHHQDLTRPVEVHLDIDLGNAVKPEDDRHRLDVPLHFPIAHSVALATRQHPLKLWRGTQSFSLEVDLGEGRTASHVPADFSVEHACFTVSRKTEAKGAKVTVKTFYKNTCPEIAPADYPAFRAAVQKAVAKAQDNIVFGGGKVAAKKK